MHGKRNETHSVRFLGHQRLEDYFANGKGTKKHIDKHKSPDVMKGKLYMDSTTNQYHKHWDDFCDSMKQADYTVNGHRPRTFEEAAGYMPAYIQELKSRPGARPGTSFSAWSVRVYFAAAAKVMGLSAADYALPTRHRRDITRSRDEAVRDKHFSVERNSELVNFCCCTGLRSRKELQQIRGTDLIDNGSGQYAIRVYGKGGRLRESVIYGTQEQIRQVVDRMRTAGEELVWPRVHSILRRTYTLTEQNTLVGSMRPMPGTQRTSLLLSAIVAGGISKANGLTGKLCCWPRGSLGTLELT